MLNAATIVIGTIVLAVIMISAYFTFKTIRKGGCAGCSCSKGDAACGQCPKNK